MADDNKMRSSTGDLSSKTYSHFVSIALAVAAISGVIGGAFAVQNYFATKREVLIIRCRMLNQFAVTDSKFDAADFRRKKIALDGEIADLDKKGNKAQSRETIDAAIKDKKVDLEEIKQSLANAEALIAKSSEILKVNKCESESGAETK